MGVIHVKKQLVQAAVTALLALGLGVAPTWATEATREPLSRYVRSRWTQRDGLPLNALQGVLAARSGYLWCGTQEGLVRFDGLRTRLFERGLHPGLAGDQIHSLAEDAAGDLWIGTFSGLSRLRGEAFEIIDPGGGPASAVQAMEWDGTALWVGTSKGLHRLHGGIWSIYPMDASPDGEPITSLQRARGGGVWIGTRKRLFRWTEGRVVVVDAPGLPADGIGALLEDQGGTLWAGTSRGLLRRRPGISAFEPVPSAGTRAVVSLFQARSGAIWIGTTTRLLRLEGDHLDVLPGRPLRFESIAEDAEGAIWLATETEGLQRLRRGRVQTLSPDEGLASETVWAVAEGADGTTWVSGDGGLDRVQDGRPIQVHKGHTRGTNLTAVLEDRSGDLWLGTEEHGLLHLTAHGATRYGKEKNIHDVRVVLQDATGGIWVGTSTGIARRAGSQFLPAGACAPVNVMAQAPDGSLWVGNSTGLWRAEGGRLVAAPLPGWTGDKDVTALHFDSDGTLWLGTNGEGLWRLRKGQSQNFNRSCGMSENNIHTILDDLHGSLWFSGNHGISRVPRADFDAVAEGRRGRLGAEVLGLADGMKAVECNGGIQPAGFRARDGRLWFATTKGVVMVDPLKITANPHPPRILLEDVIADGKRFSPFGGLSLPPGTRHLEIRYTGIGAAAEGIRFRHRLDGLDENPVQVGGERVAHYAGLRPGRYVFHLEAANESGVWSERSETLTFEIQPQLWESPWFRLLGVIALLGGTFAWFRFRVRRLRAQRRELTTRVEEEMRKVKVLSGLLPLCAWCKKIRDDDGQWQTVERYVTSRTDAAFSHGMCPECYEKRDQLMS